MTALCGEYGRAQQSNPGGLGDACGGDWSGMGVREYAAAFAALAATSRTSASRRSHAGTDRHGSKRVWLWLAALIACKPAKLAAVALVNRLARIAWKLTVSGEYWSQGAPSQALLHQPDRAPRRRDQAQDRGSSVSSQMMTPSCAAPARSCLSRTTNGPCSAPDT
ncbi:hypothetical protein MESS2_p30004 [Mesorhizobium metallidurans STM 2683]|uniref:Transposase n=1 Tax=Mesorhizobium metallidurans STM 2683 TaxID=1297569 RepID=M5EWS7_9HYPH|nr:hypothetical protein MESS2_p30004 [Mesorhizobium metallidurans STM 2683]